MKLVVAFLTVFIMCTHAQESDSISFVFSEDNPPFSYENEQGKTFGLIPDLVKEVLVRLDSVEYEFIAYPWPRAQLRVENSSMDAFCTYPSSTRQKYALFTETPLLHLEYDYLIFHKDNPNVTELLQIEQIDDLMNFVFVSQDATEWEDENIPQTVERYFVNKLEQLFHITFLRKKGDFFIMNLEEAMYHAEDLGYKELLRYKKVDFIPDSSIPFHIGFRRDFPGAEKLLKQIDDILNSDDFQKRKMEIIQSYQ